jgi:hypothetical protein
MKEKLAKKSNKREAHGYTQGPKANQGCERGGSQQTFQDTLAIGKKVA